MVVGDDYAPLNGVSHRLRFGSDVRDCRCVLAVSCHAQGIRLGRRCRVRTRSRPYIQYRMDAALARCCHGSRVRIAAFIAGYLALCALVELTMMWVMHGKRSVWLREMLHRACERV